VNPGANHAIATVDIDSHAGIIRDADTLLLQLECPLEVVRRATEIARHAGVRVILNPSPLSEAFLAARIEVDTLIVNEGEAEEIAPHRDLREARCRQLVITRGGEGTLLISGSGVSEATPPQVTPVDTVGAGDSFAGALAVALSSNAHDPVRFANAAGALATLKAGAQPAIPTRDEIEALLRRQG
jgi:ribokinase